VKVSNVVASLIPDGPATSRYLAGPFTLDGHRPLYGMHYISTILAHRKPAKPRGRNPVCGGSTLTNVLHASRMVYNRPPFLPQKDIIIHLETISLIVYRVETSSKLTSEQIGLILLRGTWISMQIGLI
jgi:hypothetical protein